MAPKAQFGRGFYSMGESMAHDEISRERLLVQAGWDLVDVLGQLDSGRARKLLAGRWEATRARAAATLQPLVVGEQIGDHDRKIYLQPSVQARFRRTLDYVLPGDRVFEIGPGRGYLAGLLLRDAAAAAYHGVDVSDSNVEATRELLKLNGFVGRATLGRCDLYELSYGQVAGFGADLVVCCEVIEHVPDPELALKTLAAALPPKTELLISVPLHGRLEDVWGHLAIFDTTRIRDMVAGSGLHTHAVEVVDSTWVFVLASHNPEPSPRAIQAHQRAVPSDATPTHQGAPRAVRDLPLDTPAIGLSPRKEGVARHRVERLGDELVCELTAKAKIRKGVAYGGLRFPVTGARGARLQLGVDGLDDVVKVHLDAYAGENRVGRWTWDPAVSRPTKARATFVLRPGRRGHFRPVKLGDLASADAFDLVMSLRPGATARLRISRLGLIV